MQFPAYEITVFTQITKAIDSSAGPCQTNYIIRVTLPGPNFLLNLSSTRKIERHSNKVILLVVF